MATDPEFPGTASILGVWRRRLARLIAPEEAATATPPPPVPLADDQRLPLYLQSEGARLQLDGAVLRLTREAEEIATAPLAEVCEVVLIGPVSITTPCLHALLKADIPVSWHTSHGWFLGHASGLGDAGLGRRLAQYRAGSDGGQALGLARTLIAAKIQGLRLMLRRNHKGSPPQLTLCRLDRLEFDAERAESLDALLGIEGAAAAGYFAEVPNLLSGDRGGTFAAAFAGRRKRPPTDPLNAALSFTYAMLTRAVTIAATVAGFDPRLGFLHQPRAGRPSLALDLIEPLRPLIADSAVITAINNGRLKPEYFTRDQDAVLLDADGRKAVISAFEQRLDHEISHPAFARPLTYRAWLSAQCRLLGDYLTGARPDFPLLRPR
jgi:CRISPR-associated endonuclease Cas1